MHEQRVHAQGREPSGAGSYGSSSGSGAGVGAGGGYAYRNDVAEHGTASKGKPSKPKVHTLSSHGVPRDEEGLFLPEEEGLFEMDPPTPPIQDKGVWESDGDWESEAAPNKQPAAAAASRKGAGLTTSTIMFDDDEFGGSDDFFSYRAGASASVQGYGSGRRNNPIECLVPSSAGSKSGPAAKCAASGARFDEKAAALDALSDQMVDCEGGARK